MSMSHRHSPRCTANPQLREDFYQQLQAAVDTIPKREVTVLMGDMMLRWGNAAAQTHTPAWGHGLRVVIMTMGRHS